MFITNGDFDKIRKLVKSINAEVLKDDGFTKKYSSIVYNSMLVDDALNQLEEKRKVENIRTAKRIAERRKLDPTYGGADWYRKKMGRK